MNIRTTTRALVAVAALAVAGSSLTACAGGDGMDGEYYTIANDTSGQIYNIATIEGNTLTLEYFGCDDELDESETSVGEISTDQSTLVWTGGGGWTGQRDFTVTDSTVTFGNTTLHKRGTEAAEQVLADQREACGE